jgi:protein SCO1/2
MIKMKNRRLRRWIFYIAGSVVFLALFYTFLFAGTDDYKVKLPILSDVKPFRFADQAGDTITEKSLLGKVCVVNFFFTTCRGICPRMNDNMKTDVFEPFKSQSDFVVVSHTVNPETDTVARMKRYADSLGVNDPKHWLFLTGTKMALYEAARSSYLLDDESHNKQKIDDQFIHTQLFALVDKDGRVRGIYDGLNQEELAKLQRDIRALLKEPPGASQSHFVNGMFNNNPS